ncbi:regulatory LuxR family protein [Asanoa ferruginea]|uniref:Regulatory LuxR family protein n=1 Tax=Asanoa ferruginea TaxID=53367 RepID=A0A3D9ZTS0_9ACTN|nr:helix-turn-helix transcriptional regulator [Asanoa ferruginea]REG00566.1 regulatory LuxR family protein [Asanoa ferruginea]GIF47730.1 transcriptional regulator [Asanoa ferruginea]
MLLGRRPERAVCDELLDAVRAGESRALVVRGEPGIGKSALLDHLTMRASGCRVVAAGGVQSEMELAFAGLHQLCAPFMDRLGGLPEPQRAALEIALGSREGPPPDRFRVGLAVLSLLAEVATEEPLVAVVDDALWVDRASLQALAFAARRLRAESVALVFATRDPEPAELVGLPTLDIAGLADEDARALLSTVLLGPVDEPVRERIIAEARGNPLALLELAPAPGTPGEAPLPARMEEHYRRRLAAFGTSTRLLVLVAAADPTGNPVLLWRAAERLRIPASAVAPAAAAGLIEIGPQVRFRHPLVRSAIYAAAPDAQRRQAHAALAEATDRELDPDRHAWHSGQAVEGPDDEIADRLERSAGQAMARGGLAAAASFLLRSAELTGDPARRTRRTLLAAKCSLEAGSPDRALALIALAEAGGPDKVQRAEAGLLRARVAFIRNRDAAASPLLRAAAADLEALDPELARTTYLEAISAAMFAGALGEGQLREAALAARAGPPAPDPPRAADLLLDGLAMRFTDGYPAALPVLRRAVVAFRDGPAVGPDAVRWLWLACVTSTQVWDFPSWPRLAGKFVRLARENGALSTLPAALNSRMAADVLTGDLGAAAGLLDQLRAATDATTARPFLPLGELMLGAWRGETAETEALAEATAADVRRRGEGAGLVAVAWALAVLHNGRGEYPAAADAAASEDHEPPVLGFPPWGILAELVEGATRAGRPEEAAAAFDRLAAATAAAGTEWALGIEERSRALITEGPAAEEHYRAAIDLLAATPLRGEEARAHLVYGEWLRRVGRRADAREQLRVAHAEFADRGMEGFAERAERELATAGETAHKRAAPPTGRLTAQEAQIARLAREGLSNPEIGERLFLSPRTVEWHLSKIFAKLRITSRRELRR